MPNTVKYLLDEDKLPKDWYNVVADLPRPPEPVLHPGTMRQVGPQDLEPLFPMALIQQEVANERTIEIPEPIRAVYRQWRPRAPIASAALVAVATSRGSRFRSLAPACAADCRKQIRAFVESYRRAKRCRGGAVRPPFFHFAP